MSGLSNLGIILTSVFSLLLLALFAELLYLLWRRRQQVRRKSNRIEPTFATTTTPSTSNSTIMGVSSPSEFLKLESIYGCAPSRVLFTIKEEEKDETEIETENENEHYHTTTISGASLGDHFGNFHLQPPEVIIMVGDYDFDVEPPFLTPCTSPPYLTPSPSPTREENV
ncbi:Serine/threonine-protein kinase KIC1 [Bienertia sinuspersici]